MLYEPPYTACPDLYSFGKIRTACPEYRDTVVPMLGINSESLNLSQLAQVGLLDVCCVSYDKDEGRPLGEGF